jgi:hypothetical protein
MSMAAVLLMEPLMYGMLRDLGGILLMLLLVEPTPPPGLMPRRNLKGFSVKVLIPLSLPKEMRMMMRNMTPELNRLEGRRSSQHLMVALCLPRCSRPWPPLPKISNDC